MDLYEILRLEHRYGASIAVAIDRLTIAQGSITGLVGPNGSGKSTLLRILGFLEECTRGEIRFEGRTADPGDSSLRKKVTLLFQEPYLLKRSVFENVAYGLRARGETGRMRERVGEALKWVGLSPEKFAGRPWYALSGGEARRVALAARLVLKPRVLLLDEPTSGVDAPSVSLIKTASVRAREEWGTTLIVATHDRFWLQAVADRTLTLVEGRLTRSGPGTFIHEPFQLDSAEGPVKVLEGGSVIRLPAQPPGTSQVALDAEDMHIHPAPPESRPGLNVLECTLLHVALENDSAKLALGLSGGGLQWAAEMETAQFGRLCLSPGSRCWLAFEVSSLRWQ